MAPEVTRIRRSMKRDIFWEFSATMWLDALTAPLCDIPSGLLFLYGALDSHPFFPPHVVSGRCFLSAAAAGALAGVLLLLFLLLQLPAVPTHPCLRQ